MTILCHSGLSRNILPYPTVTVAKKPQQASNLAEVEFESGCNRERIKKASLMLRSICKQSRIQARRPLKLA